MILSAQIVVSLFRHTAIITENTAATDVIFLHDSEVKKMEGKFAEIKPSDMKIISEAEKKLCKSTGKCVALVAFDNEQ